MEKYNTNQNLVYTDYQRVRDTYWQEIQANGISNHDEFSAASPSILTDMLGSSQRLRIYFQRNVRYILSSIGLNRTVFLLFHEDSGCLLDLAAKDADILKNLSDDNITVGTLWTLDTVGPNAVTVGFRENSPMASSGADHYHLKLQKYSMAFCPLRIRNILPPYDNTGYGIAILTLTGQESADLLTAASFTYGLKMTMHFNQTSWKYYNMSYSGYISYDAELQKDMVSIVHYDDVALELLDAPKKDYSFSSLGSLIDPPPANQEFWNILRDGTEVKDRNIILSCRQKTQPYIISTLNLNQPAIGAAGGLIKLSTPQLESSRISKQIGNNALITFDRIIGNSPALTRCVQKAKLLAQSESNTMLLGESGVGKDMFAQAIHNAGSRKGKPFIAVNCGAIPRELIASELFGYVGGSFTGAKRQGNIGKFELANGGTIFLDEIGELPFDLQASLLRAVENKQIIRIGDSSPINIDVKIISATNVNIPEMIRQHHFRADLYYRLSTTFVSIPPLRERGNDIITMAEFFILKMSEHLGRTYTMKLSDASKQLLLSHPWHGNVRELQNLIENIVQLCPLQVIEPEHIMENIGPCFYAPENPSQTPVVFNFPQTAKEAPSPQTPPSAAKPDDGLRPRRTTGFLTAEEIHKALESCGNNRTAAAAMLGISRITLYRNMKRLGIS